MEKKTSVQSQADTFHVNSTCSFGFNFIFCNYFTILVPSPLLVSSYLLGLVCLS